MLSNRNYFPGIFEVIYWGLIVADVTGADDAASMGGARVINLLDVHQSSFSLRSIPPS